MSIMIDDAVSIGHIILIALRIQRTEILGFHLLSFDPHSKLMNLFKLCRYYFSIRQIVVTIPEENVDVDVA